MLSSNVYCQTGFFHPQIIMSLLLTSAFTMLRIEMKQSLTLILFPNKISFGYKIATHKESSK